MRNKVKGKVKGIPMAIYHLSAKAISRSSGRSATGAVAYRAAEKILDERTGREFDFSRKREVDRDASLLILPGGKTADRAEFWNSVELHHKRGDATLVREVEVSLPVELDKEQRRELAHEFARELSGRYGVAADVAIHTPKGNPHAHISLSACAVSADGKLGKKVAELDPIHCQRHKIENMADAIRPRWADLCNESLAKHGHHAQIDHRSLEAQGIDREPTQHRGVAVTALEQDRHAWRDGQETEQVTRPAITTEVTERMDDERLRSAVFARVERDLGAAEGDLVQSRGFAQRARENHDATEKHLRVDLIHRRDPQRDPARAEQAAERYAAHRADRTFAQAFVERIGRYIEPIAQVVGKVKDWIKEREQRLAQERAAAEQRRQREAEEKAKPRYAPDEIAAARAFAKGATAGLKNEIEAREFAKQQAAKLKDELAATAKQEAARKAEVERLSGILPGFREQAERQQGSAPDAFDKWLKSANEVAQKAREAAPKPQLKPPTPDRGMDFDM